MSINPDNHEEFQKDNSKANKISQWYRQLLSIAGWLILLTAVILALRPISHPALVVVNRRNPHKGPLSAPATIVEFGDFACTVCGVWNESGILEKIINKYGDQVRFVWADSPAVTLNSSKAAEAARCAYDQGKFWEYHDYLFSHMEMLGVNDLKVYANFLGLDQPQFDQCLDSGARAEEVNNDFKDAVKRDITVLPTFYIQSALSETRLVGPPSYELLVSVIDPILAGKP